MSVQDLAANRIDFDAPTVGARSSGSRRFDSEDLALISNDQPANRSHSKEYNRGWADGQAAGLDACQPIINKLQVLLEELREAAVEVVRLGNQPGMDDAEWETAMSALESVLTGSPDYRESLEKANERLDAQVVMLRNRLARLLKAAEEMDDGLSDHGWAIVAAHAALEGTGQ
jgi:hypothetical protein